MKQEYTLEIYELIDLLSELSGRAWSDIENDIPDGIYQGRTYLAQDGYNSEKEVFLPLRKYLVDKDIERVYIK